MSTMFRGQFEHAIDAKGRTSLPSRYRDVLTAGNDLRLVLTRALFDAVPALEKAHEAASAIDPERGPTASIPLHPGAGRYYREREILK